MNESKHTPGPWTKQGGYLTIYTLTDGATNAIAHTLHHANSNGSVVTREQAEANANLIAASPDMLEALRPFAADYAGPDAPCHDGINGLAKCPRCTRIFAARAAIAKAGGAA